MQWDEAMASRRSGERGQEDEGLYDFSNVDDLPEELARKLRRESGDRVDAYADIVRQAPRPLNITEVMAVAVRKYTADEVPTAQSVRKYLNSAVERGMIEKPTRQTYWKKD